MKIKVLLLLFLMSVRGYGFDRDRILNNRRFVNISATHTDGFQDDIDSSSTVGLFSSYRLTREFSLSAFQSVRKFYVYDKFGGQEYEWNDLRLGAGYLSTEFFKGYFDFVRYSALYHLPTSRLSTDQELNGRLQTFVTFTKRFFASKFNVSYTPYSTLILNRKKQSQEGVVRSKYVLGNSLALSYILGSGFLIGGSVGFGQTFDEEGGFQEGARRSRSGFVDYSASLSYQYDNNWSFVGGYAHGESQEKGGAIEFYAFDPEVSSWFVRTNLSFF